MLPYLTEEFIYFLSFKKLLIFRSSLGNLYITEKMPVYLLPIYWLKCLSLIYPSIRNLPIHCLPIVFKLEEWMMGEWMASIRKGGWRIACNGSGSHVTHPEMMILDAKALKGESWRWCVLPDGRCHSVFCINWLNVLALCT